MQLSRKVALVTGGGTGIGAAVAARFAAEGAQVVVMGRRARPIEDVAAGIGGVAVSGDAGDRSDVRRAVAAAIERFGGLDILVANAGGEGGGAVADVDDETWQSGLAINLTTAFVCAREALPPLIARGGGSIVIVSSVAGVATGPEMAGYTTAKHGLLGLTRSLAVDYGPKGVRVNALCPGWVRTPMSEREMDELAARLRISRAEAFALVSADLPLRRVAEPEEIAAACLFLASEEASFVTGAVLVADGGSTAVDVGTLPFGRPE
jgi:NAD(P)-dependent dehydrogenase (short-subunit alcohol dehydrogenase family)